MRVSCEKRLIGYVYILNIVDEILHAINGIQSDNGLRGLSAPSFGDLLEFDHKLATFCSERLGVSNPFGKLIVFVALRITRRDGESISTSLNLNP